MSANHRTHVTDRRTRRVTAVARRGAIAVVVLTAAAIAMLNVRPRTEARERRSDGAEPAG